jgi:hypothetical protein
LVALLPLGIWWLHASWTYLIPVWLLVALVFLAIAGWTLFLWLTIEGTPDNGQQLRAEAEPNITVLDISIPPPDESKTLTYPLKCYVTLRNDSAACADVRISNFKPGAVLHKKFVTDVVQLKLREWSPSDHGLERVAVLPGQQFRAWIGVDEDQFNPEKVRSLQGRIGTLFFVVNGKTVPVNI